MRHKIAALAISGLAITGAIFINPGEANAREAGSGKTTATATATNSGKNTPKPVKPPKFRP